MQPVTPHPVGRLCGVEPQSLGPQPSALPLSYSHIVAELGFEPRWTGSRPVILPLDDSALY